MRTVFVSPAQYVAVEPTYIGPTGKEISSINGSETTLIRCAIAPIISAPPRKGSSPEWAERFSQ